MEEYLVKANRALLEGDRDGALKILEGYPQSIDVLWIRAHCVISEREKKSLLEDIFNSEHPIYAPLAGEILKREQDYFIKLKTPPEYQFWKKDTWQQKIQQFRRQRGWVFSIGGMFVMTILLIFALSLSKQQSDLVVLQATQTAQDFLAHPVLSPTVTSIAELGPVLYPGGQFSIIRFERNTRRNVNYSGYSAQSDQVVPATGAIFWAFQYKFICRKSVCNKPPEVENVLLKLVGGGESDSTRYVLADYPVAERIADGLSTTGWLVFEVPEAAEPDRFILILNSDQQFELLWVY